VANRSIGLLFLDIGWDYTCQQSLCLTPCHTVVHLLNSKGCCRNNQVQCCSNCNHEGREGTRSQGTDTDYKRKESTKSRVHRTKYPPLKVTRWGHTHSGGEDAHKLTLRRKWMRIKTVHKKGGSEGIGYVFEVFLLKRYLRSSTGSQEWAGGAGCGSGWACQALVSSVLLGRCASRSPAQQPSFLWGR
jgi:hypothetical protein